VVSLVDYVDSVAVMAASSYWEFHKWATNATGFKLKSKPSFRKHRCQVQQRIRTARKKAKAVLLDVVDQGGVWNNNFTTEHLLPGNETAASICDDLEQNHFTFQYWFFNWFEPGLAGTKFHDTDVLIATANDASTLVISFGGTASTADALTNLQTFEPANHSKFFHNATNSSVQGSLHRGFLNAYSRVERGSVVRLCPNCSSPAIGELLSDLDRRFGHCTGERKKRQKERKKRRESKRKKDKQREDEMANDGDTKRIVVDVNEDLLDEDQAAQSKPNHVKDRRSGGCFSKGERLVTILREVVISALESGKTVHITGHSLGGALASLLTLDVIINFPKVSVKKLHLWTFGAPQLFDDVFLQSAIDASPRFARYISAAGNGRFHRFVTLSDSCKVDAVSEVAKRTLASHKTSFQGKAARKFGGVHGHVIHFAEPHYLLTPMQYDSTKTISNDTKVSTTTKSTFSAHAIGNYLRGISRESRDHPLRPDLPPNMVEWMYSNPFEEEF